MRERDVEKKGREMESRRTRGQHTMVNEEMEDERRNEGGQDWSGRETRRGDENREELKRRGKRRETEAVTQQKTEQKDRIV